MARPDKILHAFYVRHDRFRVRIDDQEHNLSGYIAYVKDFEGGDMTYPLFEIKLLTALDHAQFEEAIWAFEIDGDISTLLLIDYALEQFHQKKFKLMKSIGFLNKKLRKLVNKI